MHPTNEKRQWLFAGLSLIILAGGLWFSAWRQAGMALPPRIEHGLPLFAFGFGLFVLGYYLIQLAPAVLDQVLKVLALVNFILALGGILSLRHYQAFFALVHRYPIERYQTSYLTNWRLYFYQPVLFTALGGSLLLWVFTLVAWRDGLRSPLIRKHTGK